MFSMLHSVVMVDRIISSNGEAGIKARIKHRIRYISES